MTAAATAAAATAAAAAAAAAAASRSRFVTSRVGSRVAANCAAWQSRRELAKGARGDGGGKRQRLANRLCFVAFAESARAAVFVSDAVDARESRYASARCSHCVERATLRADARCGGRRRSASCFALRVIFFLFTLPLVCASMHDDDGDNERGSRRISARATRLSLAPLDEPHRRRRQEAPPSLVPQVYKAVDRPSARVDSPL